MAAHIWGMPVFGLGGNPVTVKKGQRVELVIPGVGACRLLVPPKETVKVVFDANNPGLWAYHCHNLYQLAVGMFTTVVYDGLS